MHPTLIEPMLAAAFLALLWSSYFAGRWLGNRVRVRIDDIQQLGVVQSSLLGLLALLLGFSYSGAMTRFVARQDLMVAEANAIGTAWLRADLIDSLQTRVAVRDAIRTYTDARIELFEKTTTPHAAALAARVAQCHAGAWDAAIKAVREQRDLAVPLLPPFNELGDLMALQVSARSRHLPGFVQLVILFCACGGVATVGFSSVFVERRTHLPAAVLVLLVTAALWLVVDLDYPRAGFIRLDHQTLLDVRASMNTPTP